MEDHLQRTTKFTGGTLRRRLLFFWNRKLGQQFGPSLLLVPAERPSPSTSSQGGISLSTSVDQSAFSLTEEEAEKEEEEEEKQQREEQLAERRRSAAETMGIPMRELDITSSEAQRNRWSQSQKGHRPAMPMPSVSSVHSPSKSPCPPKGGLLLSRSQVLCLLLLFLGSLMATVLATYVLTREAVRAELGAQNQGMDSEAAKLVGWLPAKHEQDPRDIARLRLPGKSLAAPAPKPNETLVEDGNDQELDQNADQRSQKELGADELRLSGELWPEWYNLTLKVYVPGFGAQIPAERNLTFEGDLLLKFRVNRTTRRIELNALKLHFDLQQLDKFQLRRAEEKGDGKKAPRVVAVRVDELREKVFFELDDQLEPGASYLLRIPYSGPIASKLSGLYLTTYTTLAGEHKCAAVTQMEPTDARRMLPCFDEPEFKAVFRLTVVHPQGSTAVSNSKELAEANQTDEADWLRTDFDETLPMSSYLLALVVSDFEFVEGFTKRGTRFRIWARHDAVNLTSYALKAGIKVLEFYEQYYGIEFPLPKQDMMAFPDFAAGAMENWGLVTYREKYLLYSPQLYTAQQKMAVASVVAHELAHQWFGNLVTMRWWSDLWLNEGFATLMEYVGTDAISEGKFRMQDYFLVEALDSAFDRDSRATSHPLFFEIRKAEDVSEAFDSITYSKGASVLRMIRAVMGEDNFKRGLNIYLNRYKYRNAEHSELWDALTEAVPQGMADWRGAPFDVKQFAKRWTEQMGYPVVQVRRVDSARVALSQQRFRLGSDGGGNETSKEKEQQGEGAKGHGKAEDGQAAEWEVPIWWNVNGTEQPMEWLREGRQLDARAGDVLVLNSRSQGFYRVQYDLDSLARIRELLLGDHEKINMSSRVRIVDDTFAMAEAGRIPYEEALNLTRYLAAEKEYPPWEMALTGFNTIQNYFEDEPEGEPMRAYIKSIIEALFQKELAQIGSWEVGEDDEKHFFANLLRQRVVQRMCTLRDPRCISAILGIYRDQFVVPCRNQSMASQCSRVPVPFRSLAYCEGVHYGTEQDWDAVLALFRREIVQVEKERLLVALACSRDTYTLKRLLAMASDVNSSVIRLQDKPSVFAHVGSRIIGKKIILDYFIDHWERIYEDFKDQQTLLRSIIQSSIVGKSQRVIDQVDQFLRDNERTTRNLDVFKQRMEVVQTNVRWMQRNFAKLAQWFSDQVRQTRTDEELDEEDQRPGPVPSPIA